MAIAGLLVVLGVALLAGCTPVASSSSSADASSAPGACTREGDQCRFAEGKIGLCTAKPNCQGDGCLVCMSLH
jgi:hypothetical protein